MIRKYRIKNFGPFKLKEELNFIAQKKSEDEKHLLLNKEILPVISFYGPNGGGKTSFISSLGFLKKLVINDINAWNAIQIFLNIDSDEKNTNFYIEFEDENDIFIYELSVSIEGLEQEVFSIIKNKKGKKTNVFNLKENKFNSKFIPDKINIDNKNKKTTLLNFFNSILDEMYLKKMFNFIKNILFLNQDDFSSKDVFANNNFLNRTAWGVIEKEKNQIINIFNDVDMNIKDIIIEKNPLMKNVINRVYFKKEFSFGKEETLDVFLESSGTLKFLSLISHLLYGIKNGSLFIVDELDSGLHTKLLRYIINLFKNKDVNKNNAQLIFSSHDISTLNREVFRRDEIYFAAINESFFSNVISLSDLIMEEDGKKVRNDHNYSKLYLEGKIGYDPYIDYSMKGFKNEK